MPIFRYFVFVGGALLALLLGVNVVLTQPAGVQPTAVASDGDLPLIRIHSDRKLPERVVLDTSLPTIVPPAVKTAAVVAPQPQQAQVEPSPALAEMSAKARVRETFAQFVPPAGKKPDAKAEIKSEANTETKPPVAPQPRRKVARTRSVPPPPGRPMMLVAQQPHFGLFNTTW